MRLRRLEIRNEVVNLLIFDKGFQIHFCTDHGCPIVILTKKELDLLYEVLDRYKQVKEEIHK